MCEFEAHAYRHHASLNMQLVGEGGVPDIGPDKKQKKKKRREHSIFHAVSNMNVKYYIHTVERTNSLIRSSLLLGALLATTDI